MTPKWYQKLAVCRHLRSAHENLRPSCIRKSGVRSTLHFYQLRFVSKTRTSLRATRQHASVPLCWLCRQPYVFRRHTLPVHLSLAQLLACGEFDGDEPTVAAYKPIVNGVTEEAHHRHECKQSELISKHVQSTTMPQNMYMWCIY